MPRLTQPFALLCTLLTFAAVAYAKDDGHDKDRAAIKAAYAAMDKAYENKDADSNLVHKTDPYVTINEKGNATTRTKQQERAGFEKLFATGVRMSWQSKINDIQFSTEGASVSGTEIYMPIPYPRGQRVSSQTTINQN